MQYRYIVIHDSTLFVRFQMTRNCIPEEKIGSQEFVFVKLLVKLACVFKLPCFHNIKKKHTKPTKTLLTNLEKEGLGKGKVIEEKVSEDLVRSKNV